MERSTHYQSILQTELEKRSRVNPRYSLRAFARDLSMSPSKLCEVMKFKKGISLDTASRISEVLSLGGEDKDYFLTLVQSTDARAKKDRFIARQKLAYLRKVKPEVKQIELDAFTVISDWHHFGILELTTLKGFKNDPQWMAKKLGVSKYQIETAIKRLKNLNLIEEVDGEIKATNQTLSAGTQGSTEAIRNFHIAILGKLAAALEIQQIGERFVSNTVAGIDTEKLPEYRKLFIELRDKIQEMTSSDNSPNKTEVYAFGLQYFRLSEKDS